LCLSRGIGKGCVTKLLSEKASVIATDRDEALLRVPQGMDC
jgi:NAD(P)-dependent dehydrogenase (short-subunit alcohol dehydrogenase family)